MSLPAQAPEWPGIEDEAIDLFCALLRIDTTNPPGNERAAAQLLADWLATRGVEPKLIESAPNRANVIARVRGTGGAPPLLLCAHLDVVGAEAERWTHPPFSATREGGMIWGRGALDMKNMAAMSAMTLALLARDKQALSRDVIFAAVADEEAGCTLGSRFLVDHHADRVRAAYALGELGGFTLHQFGRRFYPIQFAEKGIAWLRMRTTGTPGHGSLPAPDSAVVRLAEAVVRLGRARLPQHTTSASKKFLTALAKGAPLAIGLALRGLLRPELSDTILKNLVRDPERIRSFSAILSNTATPTVLSAGSKINVVPGEAHADIDGRLLPGQTIDDLIREIRAAIEPDSGGGAFEFDVIQTAPATESPTDTALFTTMSQAIQAADPRGIPIPLMIPGFTDAKSWSRLGTICYGFSPVELPDDAALTFSRLYHGHDERIPEAGFRWGLRVLYDAVRRFASK